MDTNWFLYLYFPGNDRTRLAPPVLVANVLLLSFACIIVMKQNLLSTLLEKAENHGKTI